MSLNKQFVELLEQLYTIKSKDGNFFRAKAYEKAKDAIIKFNKPITSIDDVKQIPNVGKSIIQKFEEFLKNGKARILFKTNIKNRLLETNILLNKRDVSPNSSQPEFIWGYKYVDNKEIKYIRCASKSDETHIFPHRTPWMTKTWLRPKPKRLWGDQLTRSIRSGMCTFIQ